MNALTQRTHALLSEPDSLQKEIDSRAETLRKVRDDDAAVGGDIALEQQQARKRLGQQQAETSDMPQILDDVDRKAKVYEMAAKRVHTLALFLRRQPRSDRLAGSRGLSPSRAARGMLAHPN